MFMFPLALLLVDVACYLLDPQHLAISTNSPWKPHCHKEQVNLQLAVDRHNSGRKLVSELESIN